MHGHVYERKGQTLEINTNLRAQSFYLVDIGRFCKPYGNAVQEEHTKKTNEDTEKIHHKQLHEQMTQANGKRHRNKEAHTTPNTHYPLRTLMQINISHYKRVMKHCKNLNLINKKKQEQKNNINSKKKLIEKKKDEHNITMSIETLQNVIDLTVIETKEIEQ